MAQLVLGLLVAKAARRPMLEEPSLVGWPHALSITELGLEPGDLGFKVRDAGCGIVDDAGELLGRIEEEVHFSLVRDEEQELRSMRESPHSLIASWRGRQRTCSVSPWAPVSARLAPPRWISWSMPSGNASAAARSEDS